MYLSPCCAEAFDPNPQSQSEGRIDVPVGKTAALIEEQKDKGKRFWEELPKAAWSGGFVGISPLRARDFLMEQLLRRAPVEMTGGGVQGSRGPYREAFVRP